MVEALQRSAGALETTAIQAFSERLRGRVVGRDDPDYDAARALYNGMIDKRPRLIARCVDVADLLHEWVHHDRNHLKQMLSNIQAYVWPHMANAQKFAGD